MSARSGTLIGYTRGHRNWLNRILDIEALESRGGFGYTTPSPTPTETFKKRS